MLGLLRGFSVRARRKFAAYASFLAALLAFVFLAVIVITPAKAAASPGVSSMDRIAELRV
jgi:hypothetical protein